MLDLDNNSHTLFIIDLYFWGCCNLFELTGYVNDPNIYGQYIFGQYNKTSFLCNGFSVYQHDAKGRGALYKHINKKKPSKSYWRVLMFNYYRF